MFEDISQNKGNSSPGPNGFPASFYHNYFEIVGKYVTHAAFKVLNNKGNISEFNATYIYLIPKVRNPITPPNFRPISLCNVILKIITKLIANRIKPMLDKTVQPCQSAFLQGRIIIDNVILAYESIHTLENCNNINKGYVA